MREPIQLNARALAGLRDLHGKMTMANANAELATRDFNVACNAVLATLDLDPTLDHPLDLDTGVLTPAAPPQEAP